MKRQYDRHRNVFWEVIISIARGAEPLANAPVRPWHFAVAWFSCILLLTTATLWKIPALEPHIPLLAMINGNARAERAARRQKLVFLKENLLISRSPDQPPIWYSLTVAEIQSRLLILQTANSFPFSCIITTVRASWADAGSIVPSSRYLSFSLPMPIGFQDVLRSRSGL